MLTKDMQKTIASIVDKAGFAQKDKFEALINQVVSPIEDYNPDPDAVHQRVAIKLGVLFKGFPPFINSYGKDKKYEAGVTVIKSICDEFEIDLEESECFILFHLRDLGKFKIKESVLFNELKPLWGQYKDYKLDEREYNHALKNLRASKFVNYRKGVLQINPTVVRRILIDAYYD